MDFAQGYVRMSNKLAIIKVGGEAVAVVDADRVEEVKRMFKELYPDERITVKYTDSDGESSKK
ncbi:MAG: hypothetical protein QW561_05270 [Candidatus Aenigmatarchaeota archaeon]